jgi:signal transduction histidine kinase
VLGRVWKDRLLRYGVASASSLAALALTWAIWPLTAPGQSPVFFAAVVVSAYYGGLGPGLFATLLGVLAKAYFFVPPTRSLLIDEAPAVLEVVIFGAIAALVSSLTGALRAAEAENRRLFETEQAARAEAEAANRAKTVLLATVSHELRTPVQALAGWLTALPRVVTDEIQRATAVEAMQRSIAAQRRLLDDLLELSRMIAGTLRLDLEPLPLADVVATAVANTQAARLQPHAPIRLVLDRSAPAVLADRVRIEQIVTNLVFNALKFTPPDGRIEVRLEHDEGAVRIVVADTGSGIPAGELPFVFDEFRQAPPSPDTPERGLGLGLAIVRRLVDLHGGRVRAMSEGPGRGATFVVELPPAAARSGAGLVEVGSAHEEWSR